MHATPVTLLLPDVHDWGTNLLVDVVEVLVDVFVDGDVEVDVVTTGGTLVP